METAEKFDVFPGIVNENEFYSHHFFAHVFQSRIKDWLQDRAASQPDGEPPAKRLARLAAPFFQQHARYPADEGFAARLQWHRNLHRDLLRALGFRLEPREREWVGGQPLPIWAAVEKGTGRAAALPDLIILPAFNPDQRPRQEDQALDSLDTLLSPRHFAIEEVPATYFAKGKKTPRPLAEILSDALFAADHPPRFVLVVGEVEWILIDRFKWPANRFLRFDLTEVLGKKPPSTLNACVALLHRDALCPDAGEGLLDTLDAESHKHDAGVSEDLKYALRDAIELLGNEAARQLIQEHGYSYTGTVKPLDAGSLSTECVRLVYRLIFLFYIEARPELGYVPINKSDVYARGYSLEHLRDLTLTDLHTTAAQNGGYFDKTLRKLFALVAQGTAIDQQTLTGSTTVNAFELAPLDSKLFDPASTPLLNRVRFPNHVWQAVLCGLSFAKDPKTRRTRRVSYQALSINQLGAVYEALLSYRGFFAAEDLYEVMPEAKQNRTASRSGDDSDNDNDNENSDTGDEAYGGTTDLLANGWFVTRDKIGDYRNGEKVTFINAEGRRELRVYPKGTFIYRLAGRDRQKSASYYTPQSLTQCLVKYALKELLADKSADEILKLRVLEPAMGSAAFLNEAVNQLAQAYLERKQIEVKRRIPHDAYAQELQKVRMRLADGNVFGVDLNPIATELAEVSLWLNAIYGETDDAGRPKPARVPWFGYQLFTGNSLVGARPQVFRASQLNAPKKIKHADGKSVPNPECWLNAVPRRLTPGEPRREDEIYHFLLPDEGMCDYANKAVKDYFGTELDRVKTWKKGLLGRFSDIEIRRLQQLSARIDALWQEHARQLAQDRARTEDLLPVWPDTADGRVSTRASKEAARKAGMLSEDGDTATPYRRLKLVMDYWCALWFWPLDRAETLPSRAQWITEVGAILDGNVMEIPTADQAQQELDLSPEPAKIARQFLVPEIQGSLFDDLPGQQTLAASSAEKTLHDRYGELRIRRLREHFPRITQVEKLTERFRFFHWELSFADIFREAGGFDLILGNPPWLKVEWEEKGILGEADPKIAIRKMSASDLARRRAALFEEWPGMQGAWLDEFCEQAGMQAFLNATQNYPLLKGIQTNLYKCFLPQAWMISCKSGVSGFLHPEGIYDDPNGGVFREKLYPRLRAHFQFQNQLKLFSEIDNQLFYSINIYRATPVHDISFVTVSNLYTPRTLDQSFDHDGYGVPPGIKTLANQWDFDGHKRRLIQIKKRELELFADLYSAVGAPYRQARLPSPHTGELVSVLKKFAAHKPRLGNLSNQYYSTVMWDETNSVKRDGTLRRETRFADTAREWILSGPHFYVGTPLFKTPRTVCSTNRSYDVLDLNEIPDDYLARTNYCPAVDRSEYERRTPKVPWDGRPVTAFYRVVSREMLNLNQERTFSSVLIPRGVGHVHTCFASAFFRESDLLDYTSCSISLPIDFFVKSMGKGHANKSLVSQLPTLGPNSKQRPMLWVRLLSLNCLTSHYSDLWCSQFRQEFRLDRWSRPARPRQSPRAEVRLGLVRQDIRCRRCGRFG